MCYDWKHIIYINTILQYNAVCIYREHGCHPSCVLLIGFRSSWIMSKPKDFFGFRRGLATSSRFPWDVSRIMSSAQTMAFGHGIHHGTTTEEHPFVNGNGELVSMKRW